AQDLRPFAGGDLDRHCAAGARSLADLQQVGVLHGALAPGNGAREPPGGLVALARAPFAAGGARLAGPDLGTGARGVRAAARPLPRGVSGGCYLRPPFSRQYRSAPGWKGIGTKFCSTNMRVLSIVKSRPPGWRSANSRLRSTIVLTIW